MNLPLAVACVSSLIVVCVATVSNTSLEQDSPLSRQNDHFVHQGNHLKHLRPSALVNKLGYRDHRLTAVFVQIVTVALAFVVLHCFRALYARENTFKYGISRRRVAEGGDTCEVSRLTDCQSKVPLVRLPVIIQLANMGG